LLVIPIMILNFSGGIIGGVWLCVAGHWSTVGAGIVAIIASTFIVGLALMPGLLFAAPAAAALEHKRFLVGGTLGILSLAWTMAVASIWCVGSFILILPDERAGSLWPYVLWSYGVATGPWTYLSSRESQADPNSNSWITTFFVCLGAATTLVGTLVNGEKSSALVIWCFCVPILISFLFQITLFISATKLQALQHRAAKSFTREQIPPLETRTSDLPIGANEALPAKDDWYIFVNGKLVGPARFDDLQRLVKENLLTVDLQVWSPNTQQWIPARDVPGLFNSGPWNHAKSSASTVPATSVEQLPPNPQTSFQSISKIARPRKNYFLRHWRGELSLPVSYWVNCLLGNIAAALVVAVIEAAPGLKRDFDPSAALFSIVVIWAFLIVTALWQIVGTSRSATNYGNSHPTKYWGGIAKFFLIVAAIQFGGGLLSTGIPQINEYYKIYAGDQEVGKYGFKVLRDGRELEFSGGITFGAAKAFQQFADAMGGLQLVHLDSPGGRISEAIKIGKAIKERGLSTYVSHQCMSACTIIFLSGQRRLISADGKLGFHQPDFPGMSPEDRREAIASQETLLEHLGVSTTFAHRANLSSPNDMWTPTLNELLSEHVATKVVDSSDYAISGLGQNRLTIEQIDKMLMSFDIYAAVRRRDPRSYDLILKKVTEGFQEGETMSDVASVVYPNVDRVFSDALPYTTDNVLLAYMKLKTTELRKLEQSDPAGCYFTINPDQANNSEIRRIQDQHPDMRDQEINLKAQVIDGYSENTALPTEGEIKPLMRLVGAKLQIRPDFDSIFFSKDVVSPEKYQRYCGAYIAFYEEIFKLPQNDSVEVLRYLAVPN
jgi:hypothetical protein